jgi:ribosomal-protein-alanine N-acetyltransferase
VSDNVIVIETPRLILRHLVPGDLDGLASLYADPEVMRYFEGVRSREQAMEEIRECRKWYSRVGFYFWATIDKAEDRFIGRCGLLPQWIDDRAEYEVAYMIDRSHWNRGLATEAARAIRDHAFGRYHFPRVVSLIAPGNRASERVAEKNGMRYVRDVTIQGYVDRLYVVDREHGHDRRSDRVAPVSAAELKRAGAA